MSSIKFRLFCVALLSVIFLILVGIMLAELSVIGAVISLIISILLVGYGFSLRAKLKKEGKV
ncbi:DUF5325 family protein [Bacillus sp. AFS041924]|uniref:DUF5325 family protein n=1 Tax=Bacillus sp. AFS041924 TaxID=2033503 RepID=UPI000BFC8515|nr:DUF5325 family protein [Bacillus sp. AFS041924]PGS53044.1 hypothetical protein COC46_08195 [Bacillus sp. AFS041924]